jgi:hypothetical protein
MSGTRLNVRLNGHEVETLLGQLCVRYGFCLPPLAIERLSTDPPTSVEEFTEAALIAEGYGYSK